MSFRPFLLAVVTVLFNLSAVAAETGNPFAWDVPAGWTAKAASSMRIGSLTTPDGGEASIIALAGEAGGVTANVNRWRGQVGLGTADEAAIKKSAQKGSSGLGEYQWFKIINDQAADKAMLVAIVPAGDQTLFVKLMGGKDLLQKNETKFLALCKSIRRSDKQ